MHEADEKDSTRWFTEFMVLLATVVDHIYLKIIYFYFQIINIFYIIVLKFCNIDIIFVT